MAEPKLLTERELLGLLEWNTNKQILDELRERGLIAPEPVDPDLLEAREIAAKYWEAEGDHIGADGYRAGNKDDWASARIALAAFKRGKELAQPKPLTREMVAASLRSLFVNSDEVSYATDAMLDDATNRVHTALAEMQP